MAKIKNVQLKSVKTFIGREGHGFNATLYINNKKVGFVTDHANGGELSIDFEKRETRIEFSQIVKEYFDEKPATFDGESMFIEELLQLTEAEKTFKKNSKKGYPILVELRYKGRTEDMTKMYSGSMKLDEMVGGVDEETIKQVIEESKPVEYTVFRTLEDFIIA